MTVRSVGRRFIPRPWYAGAVGCCFVLILNLSLGLRLAPDSLAATGAAPVVSGTSAATDAALRDRVARDGWVKVQVDLLAPVTAAAPLDPIQTALVQADLDQAAKDLLFALPTGSYDSLLHVPGSASLTLRVDAAGLDGLLVSSLVAGVAAAGDADMQRITGGYGHSLAIKPDGSLWGWGGTHFGELGDGTTTQHLSPVQVMTGVAAVAAGCQHTLFLKSDGSLWASGVNNYGQLGDGTTTLRLSPVQVMTGVASVAAGFQHTLALKTDGSLWAWGLNSLGELGDGTTTHRWSPVQVLTGVAAVAANGEHTLAIKTDGSLWAWGSNGNRELGDGTTTNRSSPVQVLSGVVAVAAGYSHTLALKTDGSLWAFGSNASGALGDGSAQQRSAPVQVLTGVAAMTAGISYSLALKTDGSLWAWGYNGIGQLGDGSTTDRLSPVQILTGVTAVAAGWSHTLAFKTDGSLWTWGSNLNGQLGDGTTTDHGSPAPVFGFGSMPPADFVIASLVPAPTSPTANGTFSATVTVQNQGGVSGIPGTLQVWANQADVQGCGALGDQSVILPSLAPGASQTVTLSGLSAGAAGAKTLRAFVNSQCQTTESNLTNNEATTTYTVTPPILDFLVTSVLLYPSNPAANGVVNATFTVKNQGGAAGTPGLLQVWADQAGVQSCGAVGDQSATLPSIAAGDSRTVTFSSLPVGAAGAKTLRAFVDSQCLTAETDESNNQSTTVYNVTAPLPDFAVTSVVLTPGSPAANGTFSVAVTVKNKGAASGSGGWLDVWADRSAAPTCGMAGNVYANIGTLAAGASTTLILNGVPAGAPGPKTLRAFVDSFCQTTELYEDNNQSATVYTVAAGGGGPDFAVTSIVLTPSSPKANATFSVTVTVTNQGAVSGTGGWLDVWANQPTAPTCWSAGNVYASVGTLAAGAGKTFSFSGLSAGAVGTKTLRAFVDSFCGTAESNEANNQAVQSYSVSQ